MSGPPSLTDMCKPGSSSSSNNNTRNKPVSFQRPIQQKPPSHQDVDPRAKKSDSQPVQSGATAKPPSA
ncbi:hypothetical protein HanIR_Chr01g0049801 [Helianthus annuus]|nr:hypothetical protein HanIR_Chr01g0049801 [Helianthus annuus]